MRVLVKMRTSDHRPLLLDTKQRRDRLVPLQFENMWLVHMNFCSLVNKWWRKMYSDCGGYMFFKKLQFVKQNLEKWNKEVFSSIEVKQSSFILELEDLDKKEGEEGLEVEDK